jgi:phosphate-selective porin OprO/OprP
MTLITKARARRLGRSALVAMLLCGAAGAAMAAPAAGPDPRDFKMQQMEEQLQQMNQELRALRQGGGASSDRLDQLQSQMDAFAKELAEVKSSNDTNSADILTLKIPPAANAVTPSLPNGKLAFGTADGRFTGNIRSVMMFDTTHYFQSAAGCLTFNAVTCPNPDNRRGAGAGDTAHARDLNNGTNFRRARLGLDGKVFGFIDYGVVYEFGGSGAEDAGHIHEMWLQYNPPQLADVHGKIKVGAFEPIIGAEASVSTGSMAFMERPAPAEVARNLAAGDSRSAIQFYGNGEFGGDQGVAAFWSASTALTGATVGTLNSAGSFGTQPFDEQKAWIGRFAVAPHSGSDWLVHLGINYQRVFRPTDALGPDAAGARYPIQFRDRIESRTDGTRFVDSGGISAKDAYVLGLEGGFQMHNFYVEGEWFRYAIDRYNAPTLANPRFSGWYVEGSWVLTGESRTYDRVSAVFNGPSIANVFNPNAGTWGAWEVAARYSDLDLNYHQLTPAATAADLTAASAIRGGEQKIFTLGLNWYWNPTVRFMLNYQHVKIDRLSPSAGFGGGSVAIGDQIGQTINTISVRSQLAF